MKMWRSAISMVLILAVLGFANSQTGNGTTEALMTTNMNDTTTANMTTGTTTPTGKTTEPAVTTKPTPLPDMPTFTAIADDGTTVCMIISLDVIIKFETQSKEMVELEVPSGAVINASPEQCPEDLDNAYIELLWTHNENHECTLGLSFEAMGDEYTMVLVNGSYSEDAENGTLINEWEDKNFEFASAPLGNSLHCRDVELNFITFKEYKFQPFAQKSGGKFGEVIECGDDEGLSTMWIIIISVVGGVVVIGALVGTMMCVKRKRSTYQSV